MKSLVVLSVLLLLLSSSSSLLSMITKQTAKQKKMSYYSYYGDVEVSRWVYKYHHTTTTTTTATATAITTSSSYLWKHSPQNGLDKKICFHCLQTGDRFLAKKIPIRGIPLLVMP